MSVLNENLLLGATAGAAGYTIERSVRLNAADSAYFSRTPGSAGNQAIFTFSCWVKRAALGSEQALFSAKYTTGYWTVIDFDSSDRLRFRNVWGTDTITYTTTQVFRDPSAWYHIVVAIDITKSSGTDGIKMYVNGGGAISSFATSTYSNTFQTTAINGAYAHSLGRNQDTTSNYFNGYLTDVFLVGAQQLTPSSFGETNATTSVWAPKDFTGTYNTNGFKLNFSNNSATTAATLGADTSGNNNHFTPNNLSVVATATVCGEVPENQTLTLTAPAGSVFTSVTFASYGTPSGGCPSFTQGSCHAANSKSIVEGYLLGKNSASIPATNAVFTEPCIGTGKKLAVIAVATNSAIIDSLVDTPTNSGTDTGAGGEVRGNYCTLNFLDKSSKVTLANGNLDAVMTSAGGCARATIGVSSGKWYWEYTITNGVGHQYGILDSAGSLNTYISNNTNGYDSPTIDVLGKVIGFALDLDNGSIAWYENGSLNSTTTITNVGLTYFPAFGGNNNGGGGSFNFGQRPFAYTAPSGFKALCTANLAAPTIVKSADYFDSKLYTGNGSSQTISGFNFSPDFVWIKRRDVAAAAVIADTVRGGGNILRPSGNDVELTGRPDIVDSFTSTGFVVGYDGLCNANTGAYVGWAWDAGTSNATNTSGTITSTVRANTSAGFSIVTYTGNNNNGSATIGHGLGVAPKLIVCKKRSSTSNWVVAHGSTTQPGNLRWNTTDALFTSFVTNDLPGATSDIIRVYSYTGGNSADNLNDNGATYVAYCWAPVTGYSAFGSMTGNADANGPFQWCGFRPSLIIIKRTNTTSDWTILDSKREGYNVDNDPLFINLAVAESTTDLVDITSNGFKVRSTDASVNGNSGTYIWAAWAESPFQYARAR